MKLTKKILSSLIREEVAKSKLVLTELFDNLKPYPFQEYHQADYNQFVYRFVTKDNLNYEVVLDIVYNDDKTAPETWELSFTVFHPEHTHIKANIKTNKLDMSVYATIVEIFKQMHFIDKPRKLQEMLDKQYKLDGKGVPESNWMQKETKSHIESLRTNQYYAYAFDENPKRLRIYAALLKKKGALNVSIDNQEFEIYWEGPEV